MTNHRDGRGACPIYRTKGGTCRVCREAIIEDGKLNTRKTWHSDCLDRWWLHTNAGETRRIVLKRDAGVCAKCGKEEGRYGDWDADHIDPLIDGGSFELSNLQTLCGPCHKAKTAREAGERAHRRNGQRVEQLGQELLAL